MASNSVGGGSGRQAGREVEGSSQTIALPLIVRIASSATLWLDLDDFSVLYKFFFTIQPLGHFEMIRGPC